MAKLKDYVQAALEQIRQQCADLVASVNDLSSDGGTTPTAVLVKRTTATLRLEMTKCTLHAATVFESLCVCSRNDDEWRTHTR